MTISKAVSSSTSGVMLGTRQSRIGHVLLVIGFCILCVGFLLSITVNKANSASIKAVRVALGKADTVDLPGVVSDILVANPAIADVGVLRSNRLYVVGRGVGDTNVLAFNEDGDVLADVTIHVRIDQKTLQNTLKEFFPDEDVRVRTVNQNIILTGRVSNPSVANQLRDMAGRFVVSDSQSIMDLMTVKGEQQVMLKVKIVEANRAALREYGIETDYKNGIGSALSGGTVNAVGGVGLTALNPFATGSLFFDDNNAFGPLNVTLRALERDGLVNTLAEPNLTAISGEEAGFLAGGEFPVPVGADDNGISIEFRQFGVSLSFVPIVLSENRISVQLTTEVSTLAAQDGVTLVGVEIPGLSVRRASTTVELTNGGSMMMAGLIKSETVNALNGLPGISDMPVLGELFKSKSFARDESELLIMVTAVLVEPFSEAQAELVDKGDEDAMTPLTKDLARNLRRIYGDKVPEGIETGTKFGYMID